MAESLVVTDSKTDHRDDVAKLGIRLFSANEINILVKMFIEESGLQRDQFATNMWGVPVHPDPRGARHVWPCPSGTKERVKRLPWPPYLLD